MLERRDERLPVVLHELRPHAEAAGEAVGDLDLEPREPGARTQILEDVGLAPLHVAPPPERAAGPQPGERVGAWHAGAAGGAERDAAHDRERGDEREARRGVRFTGAGRARQEFRTLAYCARQLTRESFVRAQAPNTPTRSMPSPCMMSTVTGPWSGGAIAR